MAKGISINFLSNVRDFLRGTTDVEGSLDDVASSLDDLARDAQEAGRKTSDAMADAGHEIGTEVDRGADKAGDSIDQLNRKFRELATDAGRSAQQTGTAAQRVARESSGSLRETATEARAELVQNASETISSFDGTAGSIVSGVQGTLGGLVASLPPQFAALGAAGGIAIGLVASAIGQSDEATATFKADVADLTGQLLDAGNTGRRSFGAIVDEIKSLATETDDSKTNLKDLQDVARTLKVPLADVVSAYELGGESLQNLVDKTKVLQDEQQKAYSGGVESGTKSVYDALSVDTAKYENQLAAVNSTLSDQQKALTGAADQAKLAAAAGLTDYQLKADLIGQVNDAYDDAAGAVGDYLHKETGLFDVDKYIDAMHRKQKALQDYQITLSTSSLTPEAKKFLESQGEESASLMLQGYKDATPQQRIELGKIWSQAGKDDSASYKHAFQNDLGQVSLDVVIDESGLRAQIDKVLKEARKVPLQVVYNTPGGKSRYT